MRCYLFIILAFFWVQISLVSFQSSSFTFTAAADFASTSNASAVLNDIAVGSEFTLALGDLSYGSLKPETAWCDYVKSHVGSTYPFELITGNHDDDTPPGENIDGFVSCLPNRLDGLAGTYGKEYFFDYPATTTPLARFILISPRMILDGETYSYGAGSARLNWVVQAIDGARTAGIKWIVVGMHVNCISIGTYGCSQVQALYNTLVDKRVDLILSGHDHSYQRTKQLALGLGCASIATGSYDADCVVDSDNDFSRGTGSVIAIVATGGRALHSLNTGDAEAGYFAKWVGSNINPTWGYLRATVSENQMSVAFVPRVGTATDSFTISEPGTPTPVPTDTPTPTITPTSTPVPTETLIFLPVIADAYVKSAQPNVNFGSTIILEVDGNGSNSTAISYLKFDLSGLGTVQQANLKMWVLDGSTAIQTIKETDPAWTETGLTWNNRPGLGLVVTSFSGGPAGVWKAVDITAWAQSKAGGIAALAIEETATNGFEFEAREGANGAVLEIFN